MNPASFSARSSLLLGLLAPVACNIPQAEQQDARSNDSAPSYDQPSTVESVYSASDVYGAPHAFHGGNISQCPVMGHGAAKAAQASHAAADAEGSPRGRKNADWWPNSLDLSILRQNSELSDPMDDGFDYAEEFAKVDLAELKQDIEDAMTESQSWWPADWGTYNGLFIRMAWHSAGTYRTMDGRGGSADGTQRFAPLNSWPDNANLDKARRLLWPVKQKYGRSVSWADLMILAGNVALEHAGFETFGFGGGREDVWQAQEDIFWGSESEWLGVDRFHGERELDAPLAATHMGLIYVNPEGPDGNPDPVAAAHDIRLTFGRMAMNDEETVALIAGGHTLGKAHGAASGAQYVGADPEAAGLAEQGFGWASSYGSGHGADTITSGIEGAWTSTPQDWSDGFLRNLWRNEWELIEGPGGAHQWQPVGNSPTVADAHVPGKRNKIMMLTTDLSLREDPAYAKITKRWLEHPEEFDAAFAKAWYKLTHRDMGPVSRLVGDEVPPAQLWQDPIPELDHPLVSERDIALLKQSIRQSDLEARDLVFVAWSSASTYRDSDKRGGANGARIRLEPQISWPANEPERLQRVLSGLEAIQADFNANHAPRQVSLADLIVLAGGVGIEDAARLAGAELEVPFSPGRMDTTQELTDAPSFDVLEPAADAFRNVYTGDARLTPAEMLIDKANLLSLTAPEMTALLGGLRSIGVNHSASGQNGILTDRPGALTHDFFVHLLDMRTRWEAAEDGSDLFLGVDRASGEQKWTATSVDLIFGSNSELRALAEVYASKGGDEKLRRDFVAAWTKVMELDRFDLE